METHGARVMYRGAAYILGGVLVLHALVVLGACFGRCVRQCCCADSGGGGGAAAGVGGGDDAGMLQQDAPQRYRIVGDGGDIGVPKS